MSYRIKEHDYCPVDGHKCDILKDDELFIAGVPLAVARQFCEHPGRFVEVFREAPQLRATVLALEIVKEDHRSV